MQMRKMFTIFIIALFLIGAVGMTAGCNDVENGFEDPVEDPGVENGFEEPLEEDELELEEDLNDLEDEMELEIE